MFDLFGLFDSWKSRFNPLYNYVKLRKWIYRISLLMFPVWFIFGFDSGIGIWEELWNYFIPFFQGQITFGEWISLGYSTYGQTFHFSSYIIYGLLFVGISKHLESLGVKYSKNLFFSGALLLLNVAVFEWVYMACFAVFQTQRNLIEWVTSDWWFLHQYFWLLIFGLANLFAVYVEGFDEKGRLFYYKLSWKTLVFFGLTLVFWVLWVYYPFPIETFMVGSWTSKLLFPQTNYAYFGHVYIQNDLLHGVNVITKALTAVTQYIFLKGFKK